MAGGERIGPGRCSAGFVEQSWSIAEAVPNMPRFPGTPRLVDQTPSPVQRDFGPRPAELAVMDRAPMSTAPMDPPTPVSTTIQRELQSAPTQPAPTESAAPAGAPSPHAEGAAGEGDLDDLSRRLYDRIRDRLKAELYLDRERAGLLSDLSV